MSYEFLKYSPLELYKSNNTVLGFTSAEDDISSKTQPRSLTHLIQQRTSVGFKFKIYSELRLFILIRVDTKSRLSVKTLKLMGHPTHPES